MPERDRLNRIAFTSFFLAVSLFVFLSLISFHVADWPNPDVAPARVDHNLCGRAGAFIAYHAYFYLGPGALVMLLAFMGYLVIYCRGNPIEQKALRVIGVILIAAAVSGCWHLISPGSEQSLSQGNGGVLGIALGHFLLQNTALTGATLILAATVLVGLVLAADNLLMMIPALLAGGAERLRHAGPIIGEVGARAGSWGQRIKERRRSELTPAISSSQQEAAIRAVTSLDDDEDEDDLFAPAADADPPAKKAPKESDPESVDADRQEPDEFTSPREPADEAASSKSAPSASIAAVTSALARMRGGIARSVAPPAGAGQEDYSQYTYPPADLLDEPQHNFSALQERLVREKAKVLEQTLADFHIEAKVIEVETGPVITMFELQLAPGIKVAQISNLANDLARSLGAAAVRVVAPIPGKHTIGIEVPNSEKEKVRVKELLQLAGEKPGKMNIPLFLGKDASGEPLIVDLTELPHLLIAGTTGSGKSVCINSIITSIILTQRPDMVKLILVDPKMVEMNSFRDLPHLMCPIVTEMKRSEQILEWLTIKMDERYALLAEGRVRNIAGYNRLSEQQIVERFSPSNEEEKAKIPLRLPYIVVVIDELADLMMTSAKEVEGFIIRLAQKSRAVGIHIVLATQRPQATVVTGLIKSNLPSRISFRVAARMDSRIVLDQNGAEALLGQGDMLFLKPGTSDLVRAQGTYLSDQEIHRLVKFLRQVAQAHFHPELMQLNQVDASNMEKDELFDEAVQVILETRRGSVSLLQRRLTIGYSRASRLVDQMAAAGIVGEYKGSQAREVLITMDEYEQIKKQMARDAADGYRDLPETPERPAAGATSPQTAAGSAASIPDDGLDEADEDEETDADEVEEEIEDEVEEDVEEEEEDEKEDEAVDELEDDQGYEDEPAKPHEPAAPE
ncbi:MAG: DNA translocase FtsK 4TM domain-containing protein [Sedimentisphaerales bacterium]|nr:DNA translocase FtsK 4TM domain-containing protein [Sedimentisphaerales bacterium]